MPRTWSTSTSTTPSAARANSGVQKATSVAAATPGLLAAKSAARPGPTNNPFDTRSQLPRTPLGPKHANTNKTGSSRLSGSRARPAFPLTKIPRSSHVARSAPPSREPGLSTPEAPRASDSNGVSRDGSSLADNEATVPVVSGLSTPVDTKTIEEEMLAAFARTPKVPRSPPGAGGGGARLQQQASVPAESTPVDTKKAEEQMLAAFARTPKVVRTPPEGGTRLKVSGPDPVEVSAPAKEASSKATENAPRPADLGTGREAPTGDSGARAASTAGTKEHPGAGLSRPKYSVETTSRQPQGVVMEQERLGAKVPPRVVEPPPAEQLFGRRSTQLARTPRPGPGGRDENATGAASALAECGPKVPPVARQYKGVGVNYDAAEGCHGTGTVMARGSGLTEVPAGRVEPQPQQQQQLPLPSAARAATREPSVERAFAGSPWRYASPSAVSVESGTDVANVRSMAGSVASVFGGTLTPAAFKGLASGMRTPGMKRAASLVNEVPHMKSLDPVNNTRPIVAKTNPAAAGQQAAPHAKEPQRLGGTAGFRFSSSSSAAAAAAAASAAAAKKKKDAMRKAVVPARATTTIGYATERSGVAVQSGRTCRPPELPVGPGIRYAKGGVHAGDASGGDAFFGVASMDKIGETSAASRQSSSAAHGETAVSVLAAEEKGEETRALGGKSGGVAGLKAAPNVNREPIADPFVGGQKLERTPPPATTTKPSAVPGVARGGDGGAPSCAVPPKATAEAAEASVEASAVLASAEGEPDGNGVPEEEAGFPFASSKKLPRTPVSQVSVTQSSCDEASLGDCRNSGEVTSKDDEGRDVGPVDAQAVRLQIGELNREMACMADRLAKQTQERNRLTEVAFEAQDEAASLRQQIQEIQQQQQGQKGADPKGSGSAKDDGEGAGSLPKLDGGKVFGESGAAERVSRRVDGEGRRADSVGCVMELEIEKWELEQGKQEAEKEAREAKLALGEAQAKLRELAGKAEAMEEERLEEKLRQAQAQCVRDEQLIEERLAKAKLLAADTKAEIMRARVMEQERERAEQSIKTAAAAMAGKACALLEGFLARNKRMADHVAALRAEVEDGEERVAGLNEKSDLLEAAGQSANDEANAVREELEEAREGLEVAKQEAEDLAARLDTSEKGCLEARTAQEHLRSLVKAEETRRESVERRLSEVQHHGEAVVGIERARRQSTERRLGVAESARDGLAAAATAAASSALQAAAETERERRLSVERRLGVAEHARAELLATVATTAAAAAAAAEAARNEAKEKKEEEARQEASRKVEEALEKKEAAQREVSRLKADALEKKEAARQAAQLEASRRKAEALEKKEAARQAAQLEASRKAEEALEKKEAAQREASLRKAEALEKKEAAQREAFRRKAEALEKKEAAQREASRLKAEALEKKEAAQREASRLKADALEKKEAARQATQNEASLKAEALEKKEEAQKEASLKAEALEKKEEARQAAKKDDTNDGMTLSADGIGSGATADGGDSAVLTGGRVAKKKASKRARGEVQDSSEDEGPPAKTMAVGRRSSVSRKSAAAMRGRRTRNSLGEDNDIGAGASATVGRVRAAAVAAKKKLAGGGEGARRTSGGGSDGGGDGGGASTARAPVRRSVARKSEAKISHRSIVADLSDVSSDDEPAWSPPKKGSVRPAAKKKPRDGGDAIDNSAIVVKTETGGDVVSKVGDKLRGEKATRRGRRTSESVVAASTQTGAPTSSQDSDDAGDVREVGGGRVETSAEGDSPELPSPIAPGTAEDKHMSRVGGSKGDEAASVGSESRPAIAGAGSGSSGGSGKAKAAGKATVGAENNVVKAVKRKVKRVPRVDASSGDDEAAGVGTGGQTASIRGGSTSSRNRKGKAKSTVTATEAEKSGVRTAKGKKSTARKGARKGEEMEVVEEGEMPPNFPVAGRDDDVTSTTRGGSEGRGSGEEEPTGTRASRNDGKKGRKSLGRAAKAVRDTGEVGSPPRASIKKGGLLSGSPSPVPPPQKRSRKLLGAGPSRCKTPKAKPTSIVASTRLEDNAADVASAASPEVAVRVGGVGVKSGVSGETVAPAATAAASVPLMAVGAGESENVGRLGGKGLPIGGVDARPRPAVKPLKLSTNSILGMRGKSTIKGSLFQGFLDPRNGFKVPKLRAGVKRR